MILSLEDKVTLAGPFRVISYLRDRYASFDTPFLLQCQYLEDESIFWLPSCCPSLRLHLHYEYPAIEETNKSKVIIDPEEFNAQGRYRVVHYKEGSSHALNVEHFIAPKIKNPLEHQAKRLKHLMSCAQLEGSLIKGVVKDILLNQRSVTSFDSSINHYQAWALVSLSGSGCWLFIPIRLLCHY